MRHLLLTLDFPPDVGGVGRYLDHVLRNLGEGHSAKVLAPLHKDAASSDAHAPFAILRRRLLGPRWLWPRWLPMLRAAQRLVQSEKPDLIHVGQTLPVGTVALYLKRRHGVPYIVYTYGMDVLVPAGRKRRLVQSVLQNAERVVTISVFTKGILLSLGVPDDRILMLTPATNFQERDATEQSAAAFRERYRLGKAPLLLTVGRLVRRKGFDTVIRALPAIRKAVPDARYCIVGDGPDRQYLESLAREAGVGESVVFTGRVSDEELAAAYKACDVFLMIARKEGENDVEGFGIVYLDANAFGKPVIGGASGGVSDAVQDGITGLLVDPTIVQATADASVRLLSDPALRTKLGEQGRQYVLREGTWDKRVAVLREWLAAR